MALDDAVLSSLVGRSTTIDCIRRIGGGCISEAYAVSSSSGNWFVKRNEASFEEAFQCESDGLAALSSAIQSVSGIVVPTVQSVVVEAGSAWIAMSLLDPAQEKPSFQACFGRRLAMLHRATLGQAIGWSRDNFLGAAEQPNRPRESWVSFVAENRLGHQLRWCQQNKHDANLIADGQRVMKNLDLLLKGRGDETSLLHGDLWRGNYFATDGDTVALVDPAVYRGCREMDLGMLDWMGQCDPSFWRSYDDTFKLPEGWRRRIQVYSFYHHLNHLNLFGASYLPGCQRLARQILVECE